MHEQAVFKYNYMHKLKMDNIDAFNSYYFLLDMS